MTLCAEMLVLGHLADSTDDARIKLQAALDNGRAGMFWQNGSRSWWP